MLPVIASVNTFNFQTPLVNTATPGTGVVHVPYDNVAPSVSSAQVDNNSNPNNSIVTTPDEAQTAGIASPATNTPAPDNSANFSAVLQNSASNAPSGVQATFVAQLAAQDNSPETQVILVQYEKLVADGNVKYRPSDALKPKDEPSGAFGRILQSEKSPTPAVQETPVRTAASPVTTTAQASIEIAASVPASPTPRAAKSSPALSSDAATADAPITISDATAGSITVATPAANDAVPAHIAAYAATASRVESFSTAATELA